MECFNEYLEKKDKEDKKKLEDIFNLLKRVDGIKTLGYLDYDIPYIFVRVQAGKHISPTLIELDLGVRIFNAGHKVVYRLQHGPKGTQIGPSRVIEDLDEIDDYLEQGKTEQEAYNEIFRQIPKKLKKFLRRVYENINSKMTGKINQDMDAEKYRQTLNSILTTKFDPGFKM